MADAQIAYRASSFRDIKRASYRCGACIEANADNISTACRNLCEHHWDMLQASVVRPKDRPLKERGSSGDAQ